MAPSTVVDVVVPRLLLPVLMAVGDRLWRGLVWPRLRGRRAIVIATVVIMIAPVVAVLRAVGLFGLLGWS
jgi:hypothetical protein